MIEYIGDAVTLAMMIIVAIAGLTGMYNAMISHREVYMKNRERLYYRLFDETEYDEADDRSGPYYED